MFLRTKDILSEANINSNKITYIKAYVMYDLTKKTNNTKEVQILCKCIEVVSYYKNNKVFMQYNSQYRFLIFKIISGYQNRVKYFLLRENNKILLNVLENISIVSMQIEQYE